jgi:molybdenum cofactor guanylyltransferase
VPEFWNLTSHPSLDLIINAGGQSLRMGQDKALIPVPGTRHPAIYHIAQRLRPLIGGQMVVVTNNPVVTETLAELQPDLQLLPDRYPGTGPLGGLATGLEICHGWAICVACDMPLVKPGLFQYLHRLSGEQDQQGKERWDAVVPIVAGRNQTHHALYHRRCLPGIHACLQASRFKVDCFFPYIRLQAVDENRLRDLDPDLRSFFNANTPEDWVVAKGLLQQEWC